VADKKKNRPQRRNPHISLEEREYAYWIFSLSPKEAEQLAQTMDAADWRDIRNILYEIRDEMITDYMDEYGTPDADTIMERVQNNLK
jgi:hypothetical protein